ncbi:telomere-protecting terminal protein Tpg [Streptomyces sp. NPDC008240]|uniref:telomere-protecting terminal protein Tpg n=2 Tax=unclassified Streptomyces TaxID=2593676 RepID=UPI0036E717EA
MTCGIPQRVHAVRVTRRAPGALRSPAVIDPGELPQDGTDEERLQGRAAVRAPAGAGKCLRYVKAQIKKPRPDLAARMEAEVKKRWQPQIRAKARQRAATTDGIVIDTRARIGYTAPIGTTDDARLRHLTVALPPQYAARLFDAQQQGATDQQLQQITAEALRDVYFQDNGRRAGSLEEVRFTDIEHVEFDL